MPISHPLRVAILVDGGFYLKRYKACYKQRFLNPSDAETVAKSLHKMVCRHAKDQYLYRILYYDAPPFTGKAHNPITGKFIDFSKSDVAQFKLAFYDHLRKMRKVALRIGSIMSRKSWLIKPEVVKELFKGTKTISQLTENDVYPDFRQKGVDIRIALDVAALAYKRLVDQIVIISGDSDLTSALKLARREGIDVILDPMWSVYLTESLREHIDGMQTYAAKP